jgi:hypothetical protein
MTYYWARHLASGKLRTGLTRKQLDELIGDPLWTWGPMPYVPEVKS